MNKTRIRILKSTSNRELKEEGPSHENVFREGATYDDCFEWVKERRWFSFLLFIVLIVFFWLFWLFWLFWVSGGEAWFSSLLFMAAVTRIFKAFPIKAQFSQFSSPDNFSDSSIILSLWITEGLTINPSV